MITIETCSFCKGHRTVLQFQERFGDDWRPEKGSSDLPSFMREEMREHALSRRPDVFRWFEVECPRCSGAGKYEVEHFTCKIY